MAWLLVEELFLRFSLLVYIETASGTPYPLYLQKKFKKRLNIFLTLKIHLDLSQLCPSKENKCKIDTAFILYRLDILYEKLNLTP